MNYELIKQTDEITVGTEEEANKNKGNKKEPKTRKRRMLQ